MRGLLPYVDPTEDGGVPLTPEQIRRACADGAHVVPIAALDRPDSYECVECGALVRIEIPLWEMVP